MAETGIKIEVVDYKNHTTYSSVLPSANLTIFPRNSIPEDLFLQYIPRVLFMFSVENISDSKR